MKRPPLHGIRIHLSASIPDGLDRIRSDGIAAFAEKFAGAVFLQGGTLIHGSHPTIGAALEKAARAFVGNGGSKDALTLVRAQKHTTTDDDLAKVEAQREYAVVEIIPSKIGSPNEALLPMREWMAERCDVVVAIGGKHYDVAKTLAGVPDELEAALDRGRPGFAVAGFGGAIAGYVKDSPDLLGRLRNGLTVEANQDIASSTNVDELIARILSQIQLLPLTRPSGPTGRLFRILALDGGGLRGTFTAAVLAQWSEMLKPFGGYDLVKHFDMVSGTSTGAILAIGLGMGISPGRMLEFYRKQGTRIFPKDRWLWHWLKSKHESSSLAATLENVLEAKLLKDSCCRLVIPTVRAIHGEAEAIVTPHSLDRGGYATLSAVDAALASSAAPTYFDEAVVDGSVAQEKFLDGGIWANNPVLPAIAEAVGHLKVPLERIDVLSVGTLGNEMDFTRTLGKGKLGWAPETANLFFAAQESGAAALANRFLSLARHLRVNQQTPGEITLDDTKPIEEMATRGAAVGKDSFVAVRSRFLDGFYAADWRKAN